VRIDSLQEVISEDEGSLLEVAASIVRAQAAMQDRAMMTALSGSDAQRFVEKIIRACAACGDAEMSSWTERQAASSPPREATWRAVTGFLKTI
jgi:hypothetical protein